MNKTLTTLASLGFVALIVGILLTATSNPPKPKLPIYGDLGPFRLVERSGKEMTEQDLAGRVWIADFIFTKCAGPCPVLTTQMSILQNTLPREVRYVSFSVDPERDTPEELRKYAEAYGADRSRWSFLTGEWPAIDKLVRNQFKLTAKRQTDAQPGFEVLHDLRFVLMDKKGRIRGYYIASNGEYEAQPEELKKLREDVETLLKE